MSTQFKGTPGPWYSYNNTQPYEGRWIGCFDIINTPRHADATKVIGTVIPYGGENYPTVEEAEANARLIAAAPELLDALKRLVRAHTDDGIELTEALIQADKVITKATTSPITT